MIKKRTDAVLKKDSASAPESSRPLGEPAEGSRPSPPPVTDSRLGSARDAVKSLTNDFQLFCECAQTDKQIELLGRMQQQVKALRSAFSMASLPQWVSFTSALSTFFFATAQKPGFPSFSSFRTMADAIDLLRTTVISATCPEGDSTPLAALVFDESAVGRQTLIQALQAQGIRVTDCDTAEKTFTALRKQAFDVILFDTTVSGTDEFSFSTELRKLPQHHATPVILITPVQQFEVRSASLLSARCDFIAKPIVSSEAAVKAFTFGLPHRGDALGAVASPAMTVAAAEAPGPGQPPTAAGDPPSPSAEPTASDDRLVAVERESKQLAQDRTRLEQELAVRTLQLQQTQAQAAASEQNRQSLSLELGQVSRRGEQIEQQCSALEQQLEALSGTLAQVRRELAQENKRRLTAEQEVVRLAHNLQELARSETAARRQLEQSTREHAEQLARAEATLQKEVTSRQEIERTCADLSAAQARMGKQLSEGRLQALQAQESTASLEQAQDLAQAQLRDVLERLSLLGEHYSAMDRQLRTMAETLKPA